MGKARNLKKPVSSYLHCQTYHGGARIGSIGEPHRAADKLDDYAQETRALLLLNNLIKTTPATIQHPVQARQELPLPPGRWLLKATRFGRNAGARRPLSAGGLGYPPISYFPRRGGGYRGTDRTVPPRIPGR
ncbi:MAG: hypothetical protein IPJ42_00015 [Betaproteobacteria bacterium]|nr:hypothetical protein [Betaproteobacteria bacterium]